MHFFVPHYLSKFIIPRFTKHHLSKKCPNLWNIYMRDESVALKNSIVGTSWYSMQIAMLQCVIGVYYSDRHSKMWLIKVVPKSTKSLHQQTRTKTYAWKSYSFDMMLSKWSEDSTISWHLRSLTYIKKIARQKREMSLGVTKSEEKIALFTQTW